MSQSLSRILIHVVFTTKDRQRFLDESIEGALHAYLATVCREEACHAYRVGGADDHVHVVCTLSRTVTVSKLVEHIKKVSSVWMKERGEEYRTFYWQRGHGAFSIGPGQLEDLVGYISKQREHHKNVSFQDEYRGFL